MVTKQIVDYKNFGKCLEISDGITKALVTVDFGPRIIFYGFIGGENVMNDTVYGVKPRECGKAFDDFYYTGAYWDIYGGHRLWFSPESMPECYYPDNDPVAYEETENGAIFTPKPQTENGVAYVITVEYDGTRLKVDHKIENIGEIEKEFACWALSVSALGGTEIIPFNQKASGLLHNRQISIWPYTDLRDERIYLGHKWATIKQTDSKTNLKLGFNNNEGYVYYVVGGTTFKIECIPDTNETYPDNNVNFETYSCKDFTEVEMLSPLKNTKPGEFLQLTERWSLYKTPGTFDRKDDDSISEFVSKIK
ncbi:MAG: hypothetical protein KBS41_01235 [Oscillospiraceae bacterium]|nr:hypothetical protein [Candidatus Equicaccousia limihippi]